jgi:hypothetical protein
MSPSHGRPRPDRGPLLHRDRGREIQPWLRLPVHLDDAADNIERQVPRVPIGSGLARSAGQWVARALLVTLVIGYLVVRYAIRQYFRRGVGGMES